MTTARRPGSGRAGLALLAVLAYVPLLLSAPSRIPADTKLYLYLSPGRLLSQAPLTWDTSQFGGWVPHQIVAYLWPQGPWYWLHEQVGTPDWIAHRLWVGSLLLLAALGVRRLARQLDLGRTPATVAAVTYMLSPYVLPYLSRTTAMLLPWAALGWIVSLTISAATSTSRWRHPALLALVLASCSAVNATAVLMIAPAPVLWLAHAAAARRITWKRAVSTSLRIGVLAIGVSAWWIAMLRVQGRLGADVLGFSESLEATSFTTLATETFRGTGYWLFYIRDEAVFATSSSQSLMENTFVLGLTYVLPLAGLLGLATVRWVGRRWSATMLAVGMLLAVGVHPIDDPSPLMAGLAENSRSGLALALRSSARATPLVVLALALGLAALLRTVDLRTRASAPWRLLAPLGAVVVAVAAMPVVWTAEMVDRGLDHADSPPEAWITAGRMLDSGSAERRVMQLPGSEFGAFDWGVTVDPPQPGLTSRPFLTRDLLPLGSPVMMDLQYAFDDRVQDGVLETRSVAGVARLLAVDTLWIAGDIDSDRYGTTPPSEVAAVLDGAPGLGDPIDLGPVSDDGVATVRLVPVTDPVDVVRVANRAVLVVGSGDGVIDAVAAGLLDGTEGVVVSASLTADFLPETSPAWDAVVLTDSNRDRAHHWRGSQDVSGMTGTGGPGAEVGRPDESDARFDLDGTGLPQQAEAQTTAVLVDADGAEVDVVASSYGRPFVHLPERRAAMAVDGDPSTAWTTAEGADPVGEEISVSRIGRSLRLLQPSSIAGTPVNRTITAVEVQTDTGTLTVPLDASSLTGLGQEVVLPDGSTTVTVRIVSVSTPPSGSTPSGVGFAELVVDPLTEVVRLPALPEGVSSVDAVVLTRLRVGGGQDGRSDPEPRLHREFVVPMGLASTLGVALAPGTSADGSAQSGDGSTCRDDLLVVDGVAVSLRIDGTTAMTCDGTPLQLSAGGHRVDAEPAVWRVVFEAVDTSTGDDASVERATPGRVSSVTRGRSTRTVSVDGCASGCWLVVGEGWNDGWSASADGADLGHPVPMSGGNGWWLAPGNATREVQVEWSGQGAVDLALAISASVAVICLVVVVRTRRRSGRSAPTVDTETVVPGVARSTQPGPRLRLAVVSSATVAAVLVATSPTAAGVAAVALLAAIVARRPHIASLLAWSGVAAAAAAMVARQVLRNPAASPLWPLAAERFHRPVLAAVIVVTAMVWVDEPSTH